MSYAEKHLRVQNSASCYLTSTVASFRRSGSRTRSGI